MAQKPKTERQGATKPAEPEQPFLLTYTTPPTRATATSVRHPAAGEGDWKQYPWPDGDEKAAGVYVTRRDEWREPLERWLDGYTWPEEPAPDALERVLEREPFNVTYFDRRHPITRVMRKLAERLRDAPPPKLDDPDLRILDALRNMKPAACTAVALEQQRGVNLGARWISDRLARMVAHRLVHRHGKRSGYTITDLGCGALDNAV